MSSNKRPFANPNLDSSDDESTNKRTKYDEEYVSEDETFDEDDLSTEDAEASEENFSDPDYVPDTDTEGEVVNDTSENDIISDDEKSNEDTKPTNNEKVKIEEVKTTSNLSFTSKLDELKAKGISLQRAGDETPTLSLSKSSLQGKYWSYVINITHTGKWRCLFSEDLTPDTPDRPDTVSA